MRAPVPRRGLLIVGVPRSGTTLLKALLDGHPWIWPVPGESFAGAVCQEPDPVAAFLDRSNIPDRLPDRDAERLAEHLRERLPGPVSPAGFLRPLLDGLRRVDPPPDQARLWLEKTPRNDRALDSLLRELDDDTRAVVVVRDPRASFASTARRWGRVGRDAVLSFCRNWIVSDRLREHTARRHPGAVHSVRYEDLVLRTEPTMRELAEELELPWSEALVRTTRTGGEWAGNSSFGEPYQGVSGASLERWRESLPGWSIALMERLLGPRMVAHGYRVERGAARGFDARRAWVEHTAALRARRNLRRFAGAGDGG